MLTVFHIITKLDIGGAENVAMNIAKSKSEGYDYHIIEVAKGSSSYTHKMIEEAESCQITIHRGIISNAKLAILTFAPRLISLIRKYSPNVIHTHTEVPDLSLYLTSLFPFNGLDKCKIVRTIHNNQLWNRWKYIGERVESYMQANANIIAISQSTQDSYREEYGRQCEIIYNGVGIQPSQRFSKIAFGRINILFAARMEYQKGIDVMIKVVSHFGNNNQFQFHIVGTGSEKDKVEKELKRFNNIILYDKIFNLPQYIGSFDYLFMPSLFEGLALTPMEAALVGTPTIINNVPGLNEVMPNDWPLKVNNNDIDEYIKIFKSLSNLNYDDLQNRCYSYVKRRFFLDSMQKNYERLYREISI